MAESIEQARQEVQSAFATAVALAESSERGSFARFESRLWTSLLALGRGLVRVHLAQQAQRPRPVEYRHDGRVYQLSERRVSELGTRFGKVNFERLVGRQVKDRRAADLPWTASLGCVPGSVRVVRA